jgi:molecular chaperone HscB
MKNIAHIKLFTENQIKQKLNCNICVKKADKNSNICTACKTVVQPVTFLNKFNYFEMFDIPNTYDIDIENLYKRFKLLQFLIHPDKYHNDVNPNIQNDAHEASSIINKAYSTLKDDYLRAEYLLKLNGKINKEINREKIIEKDPKFLEDLLEIQEDIENCKNNEELNEMKNTNSLVLEETFKKISMAFKDNDFNKALELLNSIKFYLTIEEHIQNKI